MDLTAHQRSTLIALVDQIIPADDFPSASQNGAAEYVERLLRGDLKSRADEVLTGLACLDHEARARFDKSFASLDGQSQRHLLELSESGSEMLAVWDVAPRHFLELMVTLTNEGYYTDPSNGSNVDSVSWKMIGYDPRVPTKSVAERWMEGLR